MIISISARVKKGLFDVYTPGADGQEKWGGRWRRYR